LSAVTPSQPRTATIVLSVGAVVIAMAAFQAAASIAKGLFGEVGPQGAAALRVALGAALLAAMFRPWRARPTAAAWRPILVYGVALGVMNTLFYTALATVPLGVAVTLEFSGPLAVAAISSRRPIDFLWIGLAAAGLVLILRPSGSPGGALSPVGVACALGAGVCWALYIVFGRRAGAEHGMQTTALGMLVAAAIVVPIGAVRAGAALLAPHALLIGVAVGFLGTALPYALEMFALTRLPARTFGTLMSLEPAIGALTGLALLHQVLTLAQWMAIAAVVAASAGAAATIRTKSSPAIGEL
jgi:inner membrane transporter RhtA